ncbi:hypothetical protein GCM10017771_23730 [Streptomyces capitiformicae]|uniref:Uncharacterized protein n=1 Tax=Streptomyces capitiformicae TaxID=2014920 RepID=A0A919GKI9_9ACTN|nr:hypothetical protein GCM10017771_23730 [Streptomyces capitiformicae]
MIAFAVELPQLRAEVGAHVTHDLFAAPKDLVGEWSAPVLGVKTKCAWRVWTTLRPLRISGFGSRHGDIDQCFICRGCGVVAHADRNASHNIATRGESVWNAGRESHVPATP